MFVNRYKNRFLEINIEWTECAIIQSFVSYWALWLLWNGVQLLRAVLRDDTDAFKHDSYSYAPLCFQDEYKMRYSFKIWMVCFWIVVEQSPTKIDFKQWTLPNFFDVGLNPLAGAIIEFAYR